MNTYTIITAILIVSAIALGYYLTRKVDARTTYHVVEKDDGKFYVTSHRGYISGVGYTTLEKAKEYAQGLTEASARAWDAEKAKVIKEYK